MFLTSEEVFPNFHGTNTRLNSGPNWQAKTFTEVFLNTISNFIPNKIVRITPNDPTGLTKPIICSANKTKQAVQKLQDIVSG